ncbi:MAG: calcium-binding protein [Tabrizicola sp.]|nr:calcium-binding protein [Tabrizicola sp.]
MRVERKTVLVLAVILATGAATTALAERGEPRGAMLMDAFDAMDADKDGKVTEAEIADHRRATFTAADADGNGLLSVQELKQMGKAADEVRQDRRVARMMERMDADGDGSLSASELSAMQGSRMFARVDADKDGAITKAEVEAARDRQAARKHGGADKDDGN